MSGTVPDDDVADRRGRRRHAADLVDVLVEVGRFAADRASAAGRGSRDVPTSRWTPSVET